MPQKPGRPCRQPGCPHLANSQTGYCDAHDKQARRQADAQRLNSNARGYTYRWQVCSKQHLGQNPLCFYCLQGDGYFDGPLFKLDKEIITVKLQRNRLDTTTKQAQQLLQRIDDLLLQREQTPKQPERITAAALVDHFIPHKGDQSIFWDKDDWKSSCNPCHGVKTAKEDGAFGNTTNARG